MAESMIPNDDNKIEPEKGELPEQPGAGSSMNQPESEPLEHPRRKKVRVKVRKKIRIKRKPSAKKMLRKVAERAFWTIIIVGFIASLIIMIVELDIRDEKFKQQRKKTYPVKNH